MAPSRPLLPPPVIPRSVPWPVTQHRAAATSNVLFDPLEVVRRVLSNPLLCWGYHRTVVGIDAQLLIRTVLACMRNKKYSSSALVHITETGANKLMAPERVAREVERCLPVAARSVGLPEEDAMLLWRSKVLPLVHLIDEARLPAHPDEALVLPLDADDAPFVRVIECVAPDFFAADDKHFRDLPIPRVISDRQLGELLCQYHVAQAELVETRALAVGATVVVGGAAAWEVLTWAAAGIEGLVRALGQRLLRGSAQHEVTAVPSKPTLLQSLHHAAHGFRTQALAQMEPVAATLNQANRTLISAEAPLDQYRLPGPGEPTFVIDYVHLVLRESPVPLSASQVAVRVERLGFQSTNPRFPSYVRRLLRSDPARFSETQAGWMLGRCASVPTLEHPAS